MNYSRVDKLILSQCGLSSLADAQSARDLGFHLVLPIRITDAVKFMAKASIAIALRTVTGDITITTSLTQGREDQKALFAELEEEAALYGQPERVRFGIVPDRIAMKMSLGAFSEGAVIADAAGWQCAVNRILSPVEVTAAPAAALAVAFAFAKLFNFHVLGKKEALEESWSISLDTMSSGQLSVPSPSLDIGKIALLGAGAIGSATIFVLKNSGWRGCVEIIDYDRYDRPNEETTFLLGLPEVGRFRHKAIALAERGTNGGLFVTPIVRRIENREDKILRIPRDAFLCAVDNAETRRLLDKVDAKVVLNAAVGGNRMDAGHVLWTRHLKNDLPLSSVYPRASESNANDDAVPNEISDECSRVAYRNISFAAPFMALAAGSLLSTGCAYRATGNWPQPSRLKFDLFGYQSKFYKYTP